MDPALIKRFINVRARVNQGSTPGEQEAARKILEKMRQEYPGIEAAVRKQEQQEAAQHAEKEQQHRHAQQTAWENYQNRTTKPPPTPKPAPPPPKPPPQARPDSYPMGGMSPAEWLAQMLGKKMVDEVFQRLGAQQAQQAQQAQNTGPSGKKKVTADEARDLSNALFKVQARVTKTRASVSTSIDFEGLGQLADAKDEVFKAILLATLARVSEALESLREDMQAADDEIDDDMFE